MDDEEEDYFVSCNYWIVESESGVRALMKRDDALKAGVKLIMSYADFKKNKDEK